MRPICKICQQRPCSVNYRYKNRTYYRSRCDFCIARNKKIKPPVPKWQSSGYKKKTNCDRCGFRSRYQSQLLVVFCDGNLLNTTHSNLRTICLNCLEEVKRLDNPWIIGDLQEDYRYIGKDKLQ
jgi:hypothetical protein